MCNGTREINEAVLGIYVLMSVVVCYDQQDIEGIRNAYVLNVCRCEDGTQGDGSVVDANFKGQVGMSVVVCYD